MLESATSSEEEESKITYKNKDIALRYFTSPTTGKLCCRCNACGAFVNQNLSKGYTSLVNHIKSHHKEWEIIVNSKNIESSNSDVDALSNFQDIPWYNNNVDDALSNVQDLMTLNSNSVRDEIWNYVYLVHDPRVNRNSRSITNGTGAICKSCNLTMSPLRVDKVRCHFGVDEYLNRVRKGKCSSNPFEFDDSSSSSESPSSSPPTKRRNITADNINKCFLKNKTIKNIKNNLSAVICCL